MSKHLQRRILAATSLLWLLLSSVVQAADADGKSEHRIISLAPHITELLYVVGAGDKIVGTMAHSDYPPEAENIPRIGSHNQLNYEEIIKLQPTLIFGWTGGNSAEMLSKLEGLGFQVHNHNPKTLSDIGESLKSFGELTDHTAEGLNQKQVFMQRLARLQKENATKTPVRVYYQMWHQPQMTVNEEHLISDVIRLCGGSNIFADAIPLVPRISVEAVVRRQPDIIIAASDGNNKPEWLDDWQTWPNIPAVKNDQLYGIYADWMHRHTPRILDAAERMCSLLDQQRWHALGH